MPKVAHFKNRLSKAFTLIEVLIVIGILGILATVALVAINPAEAQKKARDTQRLKDMATLQSIIEQWYQDNPGAAAAALAGPKTSSSGLKVCAGNWLGVDMCPYANVIPVDPSNRTVGVTDSSGAVSSKGAYYYFETSTTGYKLCTYLESTSNKTKVASANDGGNNNTSFELFSAQAITCGP